LDNTPIRNIYS